MQSTCIVETTGHFIGAKYWRLNNGLGGLHRDEIDPETGLTLHAVEYPGGNKEWWQNDILHRDDGPARETMYGETYYHINGEFIPQLYNKRIYGKEKLAIALLLM